MSVLKRAVRSAISILFVVALAGWGSSEADQRKARAAQHRTNSGGAGGPYRCQGRRRQDGAGHRNAARQDQRRPCCAQIARRFEGGLRQDLRQVCHRAGNGDGKFREGARQRHRRDDCARHVHQRAPRQARRLRNADPGQGSTHLGRFAAVDESVSGRRRAFRRRTAAKRPGVGRELYYRSHPRCQPGARVSLGSLHAKQFDVEDQRGIRWNDAAGTACAIAEFWRNNQRALTTDFHGGDAFVPAGNDLMLADRK